MTIRNFARAQVCQLSIHLVGRDRAMLNVNQSVRIAAEISNNTVFGVDCDAVSICILQRRGDDRAHRRILKFPNALQNVAHLSGFGFKLTGVIDVLVGASATAAKVGTTRLDPVRRRLFNLNNFPFSEMFLLPSDSGRNQFTVDCERNKNGFAVFARYTFAAKSNVLDLKIDDPHTSHGHSGRGIMPGDITIALAFVAKLGRQSELAEFPETTRSIAAAKLSTFTGLTRCSANPASKLFSMSPFIPKPLIAIPGIGEIARRYLINSIPEPSGNAMS